jgi:sugar lactone lactonase YvrE
VVREERRPVTVTVAWREWTFDCPDGWSHHGVETLPDGTIVGYHPKDRELLFFDTDGALLRTASCEAREAHDIVLAPDGLWIADCGNKLSLGPSGSVFVDPPKEEAIGQVLLVDLDGRTLRRIDAWHDGPFLPTGVAIDDRGLWIADGYGSNRVDLIAPDGAVLVTIAGLDCPHAVLVDHRRSEPLLYVAERGAGRLCVYDLDGRFIRYEGAGDLIAPCSLVTAADHLYIADLVARVTVLDLDGNLVTHVGADTDAARRPGWPNATDEGRSIPPELTGGRFNSPHGITVIDGDLVVTEWLLGGRWVRTSATGAVD